MLQSYFISPFALFKIIFKISQEMNTYPHNPLYVHVIIISAESNDLATHHKHHQIRSLCLEIDVFGIDVKIFLHHHLLSCVILASLVYLYS